MSLKERWRGDLTTKERERMAQIDAEQRKLTAEKRKISQRATQRMRRRLTKG